MSASRGRPRPLLDAGLGALLIAATGVYLWLWPRDFYLYDEGFFLYEAKRIADGQVMYRDFYEIMAPAPFYAMAAWFAAVGVSFAAARVLMGVIHAAIVVLVYATTRQLTVARPLACTAALAHLAVGYPGLPISSQHWFGTLVCLVLLAAVLHPRWRRRPFALGAVVGLLIVTQHQKSVVFAAATVAVLAGDGLLFARAGLAAVVRRLLALAAGGAAVFLPVAGYFLLRAGAWPLYDALVRFPLENYRAYNRTAFGASYFPAFATLARVITALTGSGPLLAGAAAWRAQHGGRDDLTRDRLAAGIFACAAVLSIAYHPDATHLAIIAPLGLVAGAGLLDWALRAAAPARRVGAPAVAALLLAGVATLLANHLAFRRQWYHTRGDTAAGPVDFESAAEIDLVGVLRRRLDGAPSREVFGYPFYSSLYLLVGADNPTRHQILLRGYSDPHHFDEVMATLDARRVPYVVVAALWVDWEHDPFMQYLKQHYERVPLPQYGGLPPYALFERKPEPPAASPGRS